MKHRSIEERVRRTLVIDVDDLDAFEVEELKHAIGDFIDRLGQVDLATTVQGWSRSTLAEALRRLEQGTGEVQAKVIRHALQNGGFADRSFVYRVTGWPEDRTLRGFTRPANRILREMQDEGLVPAGAEPLLSARYNSGVVADGFTVPPDLRALL